MPIVPAVCPNCGANLNLEREKKAAVCPYCNTPFIVEEAVNNYVSYQTTNVEHLHADKVVMGPDVSKELLDAGNAFLQMKNYEAAAKKFRKLTEQFPGEWKGWWGLLQTCMASYADENFRDFNFLGDEKRAEEYYRNISALLPGSVPADISEQYARFAAYLSRSNDALAQAVRRKQEQEQEAQDRYAERLTRLNPQEYHVIDSNPVPDSGLGGFLGGVMRLFSGGKGKETPPPAAPPEDREAELARLNQQLHDEMVRIDREYLNSIPRFTGE